MNEDAHSDEMLFSDEGAIYLLSIVIEKLGNSMTGEKDSKRGFFLNKALKCLQEAENILSEG